MKFGSSPSLDIANGNLDAAIRPAFAVENKVKIPITAAATPIAGPPIFSVNVYIGLRSVESSESGMFETKTKETNT